MPRSQLDAWKILAGTVRGPTHVRSALPNQDHYDQHKSANSIVAAVSDGHGSTRSFRSERGSKIAAETVIEVVNRLFTDDWDSLSLQDKQQQLKRQLPRQIVEAWREKVARDLNKNPLTAEQQETLVTHKRPESHPAEIPYIIYGATLLTVVITSEFVVYLQLGDGDILTVLESGEVVRPLPIDERLFGNETTSLSSEKAESDFRVNVQLSTRVLPSLILLATDGYSNSFKDDAGFLKAGDDFRQFLQALDGSAEVKRHLTEWLEESAEMSGDDVTLCLIHRELNLQHDTPSVECGVDGSNDPETSLNTDDRNPPASKITGSIQSESMEGNQNSPDGEST